MRRLLFIGLVVMLAAVFGMSGAALAADKKAGGKTTTMEGYVIDSKCAEANKDNLGEFVKTHEKDCALAPACKASGYNLYSDGKLYKFDKASSAKVGKFLAKDDSKLHVKADIENEKGDMVKLVKITNAE